MKHWKKERILAAILALCLLIGLTACGDSQSGKTEQTADPAVSETESASVTAAAADSEEMGYVANYLDLDSEINWGNTAAVSDGSIYFSGTTYDEATGLSAYDVLVLDEQGNLKNTVSVSSSENRSVYNLTPCDGFYLAYIYEWAEDETDAAETAEAAESEDDTEWIYEEEEEAAGRAVYAVAKYSLDAELLAEGEITPTESDYFSVTALCADGAGNAFVASEQTIYVFDSDLNFLFAVETPSWIMSLFTGPNGQAMVCYDGDNGRVLAEVDAENQCLGEELTADGLNLFMDFTVGGDGQLYGYDDNRMYRFDLETGTSEQVIYWLDWDVDGENLYSVAVLENGDVMTFGFHYSSNDDGYSIDLETCLLQCTPLSEIPQKTELTLGVEDLESDLYDAVLSFNRQNETYRIVVRDYSSYATDEDAMAGFTQLEQDVLSGNCPDILVLDNLSVDDYIRKGILADLYTLMGEDTCSKEDFVQSYLRVMERNGSLYSISANFDVYTLAGAKSYVGDGQGWTLEEFIAAANALPEGGLILDGTTRDSFLNTMLCYLSDTFVDWDSGESSFDSGEFAQLLQACMLFPEDTAVYDQYHIDNGTSEGYAIDESYYTMAYDELKDGAMLLMDPDFWSVSELISGCVSCMGDEITLIGYPGAAGNGTVLKPGTEYGISASSENQDAAWEFLCSVLSRDSVEIYTGFPVLEEKLTEELASTMEQQGYTDEDGNFVAYEDVTALTQEQVDRVRACIDGAECLYHYDEQIISIVTEEAAAYFAGQKTAEEVAEIIQNRVQIYVDEQG